jgi:hypothetical protein
VALRDQAKGFKAEKEKVGGKDNTEEKCACPIGHIQEAHSHKMLG